MDTEREYSHMVKNKMLPGGKLISYYQIMTGYGLSELEMKYIDEVGIIPEVPEHIRIIPKGFYKDDNGNICRTDEK